MITVSGQPIRGLLNNSQIYLNSSLGQLGALSQLFASVHVRVLSPLETSLQLVQLVSREGGP